MVNLAVDLRDERFASAALAGALRKIEAAGYTVERGRGGADFLAWIDEQFGGTWSSEAFAGESVIARKDGAFAGFATYDPHGLKFSWLRGAGSETGTGIFGPFGVARAHRGSGIGPQLLAAALCSLRERGYIRALIPAVGEEKLVEYYERNSGASVLERFARSRWKERRFRTVVLASGSGTNFQSVADAVTEGRLPLDLSLLFSNKPQAYALTRARHAGVHAVALAWDRKSQTRAEYDSALFNIVEREDPELVLLLGWMHVLDEKFVRRFPHAINIHPAFLPLDQRQEHVVFPDNTQTPAFRGANAVADALAIGSDWVGASSHLLALEADRGPLLVRAPMAVHRGEKFEQVMERLHPLEHRVLASGIMRWVFEQ